MSVCFPYTNSKRACGKRGKTISAFTDSNNLTLLSESSIVLIRRQAKLKQMLRQRMLFLPKNKRHPIPRFAPFLQQPGLMQSPCRSAKNYWKCPRKGMLWRKRCEICIFKRATLVSYHMHAYLQHISDVSFSAAFSTNLLSSNTVGALLVAILFGYMMGSVQLFSLALVVFVALLGLIVRRVVRKWSLVGVAVFWTLLKQK